MKYVVIALTLTSLLLGTAVAAGRPSNAELQAFKVYHHAVYLVTTAEQAGGTNKLLHTTELPIEGTDPVVTPALDHIYTKAVLDLTDGPVVVELPTVEDERYFSIQIADQEHYTIYDEINPVGKYAIVRKGKNMAVPDDVTVIESQVITRTCLFVYKSIIVQI